MKKIKKGLISSTIGYVLGIILLIMGVVVVPYSMVIQPYAEYIRYKDSAVTINAVVSDIYEYEDSDDDEHYEIYLSYDYRDKQYRDVLWETISTDRYNVGDIVTVKISIDEPEYVLKSNRGTGGLEFILVVYAMIVAGIVYDRSFYNTKKNDDLKFIDGRMIVNDLSPKAFIAVINAVFGFLAGMCGAWFFLSSMGINLNFVPGVLFIAIITFIATLCYIYRIPQKGYRINIHRCLKKWSENDGETTFNYVQFEAIRKTSHGGKVFSRAEENVNYYLVMKGENIKEIYDTRKWILSGDDNNLRVDMKKADVIKVLFRVCIDAVVCPVIMFFIPLLYEVVAQIASRLI